MTREEATTMLKKLRTFHNGNYAKAIDMAIEALSADRPSGTWEHWGSPFSEDDIINTMVCTNCGMRFVEIKGETFYYCPSCGARMGETK